MAKQMIKGLTMLGFIVTLAFVTAVASAQGQSSKRQVANIPFEFVVGDKSLPAGEYDVTAMTPTGETLRVRGTENAKSAIRLSSALTQAKPAEKGKLVFRRYANRYFLAEVWTAGDSNGRQLRKSSAERAIQREVAAIPSKSGYERVEIVLVSQ